MRLQLKYYLNNNLEKKNLYPDFSFSEILLNDFLPWNLILIKAVFNNTTLKKNSCDEKIVFLVVKLSNGRQLVKTSTKAFLL